MDAVFYLNLICAPALLVFLQIFGVIKRLHEILQNNQSINTEINKMTKNKYRSLPLQKL